ncbi:MAG TPA: hypothetical protein VJ302_18490 [Blastocatellia bacterium]|nr:hypothetical protein [Blastocatellia bacterium]
MAKAQDKASQAKEPDSPDGEPTAKKDKDKDKDRKAESKDEDALVGQVKKVIKKSRRKLSEQKFEKQLRRTIAFLEDLQSKLVNSTNSVGETPRRKRTKTVKKTAKKARPKPKTASKKKKTPRATVKQPSAAVAKLDE